MALRVLDTDTLDAAARSYAAWFVADSGRFDRDWVMKQFSSFTHDDEFEYLLAAMPKHLGPEPLADFKTRLASLPPRKGMET